MKELLHEAVRKRRLVCDGAMGTQLMHAGLEAGSCGELWNLTHPERILTIHKHYVDAGADCVITNTFGANRIMLHRHGHGDRLNEIHRLGVHLAREAVGNGRGFVLGGMGPLGAILEPYGDLSITEAEAAYSEQASALVEAGVDAVIIETQTALEEVGIAIKAAVAAGAPSIIASFAFDASADETFYVTMMGLKPETAAQFAEECGAHIVALNCGTGMDMVGAAQVVRLYHEHCGLPTMAQPNAGLPVLEEGKVVYRQSAAEMALGVPEILQTGGGIVGSCCGSTPEHTLAIRRIVDDFNRISPHAEGNIHADVA